MGEITNLYITEYLNAIREDDEELVRDIYDEAKVGKVPVIKMETKDLLGMLLTVHKPRRVLEIGTAIGYSAIVMSRVLEEGASITTIERSDRMIEKARKNIRKAKAEDVISLLEGDAKDILPKLEGEFDFIFMDAAKGQYMTFLPDCLKLLKKGGILFSDNVLQDGFVAKSKWSIPRRQRTIHQRMRQYLWELNHNKALQTSICAIGDGVAISVCRRKEG